MDGTKAVTKSRNSRTRSAAKLTAIHGGSEPMSPGLAVATAELMGIARETEAMRAKVERRAAEELHPSWCHVYTGGGMPCGSHISELSTVVATAGGYSSSEDGAVYPLVAAYARMFDDGRPAVSLDFSGPDDVDSGDFTPAEARHLAAELVRLADLAETPGEMTTYADRKTIRVGATS